MFIRGKSANEFISLAGIGAELAHMDAESIATLFNSFVAELFKTCEISYYAEMQLDAVGRYLTEETKEKLACLIMQDK